jgi:catechol 2,3-dioxygenase-like lactoylglutathione lyase family enzyme
MIGKIDHIGIAVKNLDEAVKLYTGVLGLEVEAVDVLEDQKVKTAVIKWVKVRSSFWNPLHLTGPWPHLSKEG